MGAHRPAGHGGGLARRPARLENPRWYAKPVGSETLILVTSSVTRTATLIRPRRSVSNWASRQKEGLGAKPRRPCISQ